MYNAIKFFGSVKELLAFTRSLRVAELLEQEYNKNVHTNHTDASVAPCLACGLHITQPSSIPDFSEEHGCE